jgi:hypothetical protein
MPPWVWPLSALKSRQRKEPGCVEQPLAKYEVHCHLLSSDFLSHLRYTPISKPDPKGNTPSQIG